MKIYVKFEIPKTVREFLKEFFKPEENNDNYIQNVTTYTDKGCSHVQCTKSRNRSFREVCDCVQTYFPKVTDKTIFRILLTLNLKNSKGKLMYFFPSFCNTVNRPVMLYYVTQPAYYSIATNTSRGIDKQSWSEIFAMYKLTDAEKIKQFIEKYKDR